MAGPTLGNTLFGMPTVSIGGTTFYTTGSAEVGVEGSTEFGRVAELAAPHTGVFVSRQPFVTATLAEVNESAIGTLWDVPDEDVWCNPALKTPTSTACVLTHGSTVYTLTITPKLGADTFKPLNINGSQRGGRPIVQLLPERIADIEIIEGEKWNPTTADNFILVPLPDEFDPAQPIVIKVRGKTRSR